MYMHIQKNYNKLDVIYSIIHGEYTAMFELLTFLNT